jgi:NADH:ubiquinone oxidoreductase subunit 6 (subunit J)
MEVPLLFWIIAGLTAFSAVGVVVTQNIVRAAAFLLFALGGTAGIFFLLGADFVGATQLLIYVGGTLVLVVFGVMLTAQGPFISMKTGPAEWTVATVVGLLLYGVIAFTVIRSQLADDFRAANPVPKAEDSTNSEQLGNGLLGVTEATPDANLTGLPGAPRISQAVAAQGIVSQTSAVPALPQACVALAVASANPTPRTRVAYLLPFEIVSVHLLVVLIGAAYLARAKRRRTASAAPAGSGGGGEGDFS